jgi:hypothetical protein
MKNNLLTNISIIALFKYSYVLCILAFINFIFHLVRGYHNPISKLSSDKNTYGENKDTYYVQTISLLKELMMFLFEIFIIILSFNSESFKIIPNVLYVIFLPFLFKRFHFLFNDSNGFVESKVLNFEDISKKILYYPGYLIMPLLLISLRKFLNNGDYGLTYLNFGIIFLILKRIINVVNISFFDNLKSETFLGLILEYIAFGSITGTFFFSDLVKNSAIQLFQSQNFLPIYLIIIGLVIGIIVNIFSKIKNNSKK